MQVSRDRRKKRAWERGAVKTVMFVEREEEGHLERKRETVSTALR